MGDGIETIQAPYQYGWANGKQTVKSFYDAMYQDVTSPSGKQGVDALLELRHSQPDYDGNSINRDWLNISDQVRQQYNPSLWNKMMNLIGGKSEASERRSVVPMANRTFMPNEWEVTTERLDDWVAPTMWRKGYNGVYNQHTGHVKAIDDREIEAHEMAHAVSYQSGNRNRTALTEEYWYNNPEELLAELSTLRRKYNKPIITKEDASQFYNWMREQPMPYIPKKDYDEDEESMKNMYYIIQKPANRSLIENIMRGIVSNQSIQQGENIA